MRSQSSLLSNDISVAHTRIMQLIIFELTGICTCYHATSDPSTGRAALIAGTRVTLWAQPNRGRCRLETNQWGFEQLRLRLTSKVNTTLQLRMRKNAESMPVSDCRVDRLSLDSKIRQSCWFKAWENNINSTDNRTVLLAQLMSQKYNSNTTNKNLSLQNMIL